MRPQVGAGGISSKVCSMARSRRGGTSGLLSGKVGDVIYSVTRNPDGSFRQSVSANPSYRENPNTDAQARARLTMAVVERAMFTFSDFVASGIEGVERGTLTVSEWSRLNYEMIRGEVEDFWNDPDYTDGLVDYPKKGVGVPRDGSFIVSRGSLKYSAYWSHGAVASPAVGWVFRSFPSTAGLTVATWLARNQLRIGDQLVYLRFMRGRTPSKNFLSYCAVYTDAYTNPNTIITPQNFRNILKFVSNVPVNIMMSADTLQLVVTFADGASYDCVGLGSYAWRYRRQEGGKIFYNNAEMLWSAFPTPQEAWGWQTIADVKPSWIE